MLDSYIKMKLKKKEILLMTHIVAGYPSYENSFKIIEKMVNAGVDMMELQIPFSEPIADGPVILKANQQALSSGATVKKSLEFVKTVTKTFDIPFLFMSYYNILFKFGIRRFIEEMVRADIKGAIIPDLPPEEGDEYLKAMNKSNLSPIFIFSPTTTPERMKYISSFGKGFIYCVARKGVTGFQTSFSDQLDTYISTCRKSTRLPLALGFGVKDKKDINYLKGKVDIAVVGSQTIRMVDKKGVDSVEGFIRNLR